MVAQSQAEKDKPAALKDTVGKYYKTTMDAAINASNKQPIHQHQRSQTQFILDPRRIDEGTRLRQKLPDKAASSWTLLEVGYQRKSGSLCYAQAEILIDRGPGSSPDRHFPFRWSF